MSAKDPRRSVTIHVAAALRQELRAERRRGRSHSAAAALRRIVERELRHGYSDRGQALTQSGPGYRLQLGRPVRRHLSALGQRHGVGEVYIVTQLLAAAAARSAAADTAASPQ